MLVLAPTRELAMQSQKVLEEFGKVVNVTSAVIYGGVPKPP
jgi:ATP-dependent RNA helicase DBP3